MKATAPSTAGRAQAFSHQTNRTRFSPLSALYKFPPAFPLSDPTQPLSTLKVVHHSAAPVAQHAFAIDRRA